MSKMRRKIFFDVHGYGNDVILLIVIGMKDNYKFVKNYKKVQKLQNKKLLPAHHLQILCKSRISRNSLLY